MDCGNPSPTVFCDACWAAIEARQAPPKVAAVVEPKVYVERRAPGPLMGRERGHCRDADCFLQMRSAEKRDGFMAVEGHRPGIAHDPTLEPFADDPFIVATWATARPRDWEGGGGEVFVDAEHESPHRESVAPVIVDAPEDVEWLARAAEFECGAVRNVSWDGVWYTELPEALSATMPRWRLQELARTEAQRRTLKAEADLEAARAEEQERARQAKEIADAQRRWDVWTESHAKEWQAFENRRQAVPQRSGEWVADWLKKCRG